MPRAAVPSPLLAATMRLEIESVHEFVAGTILYSHRIPVLVQSGIVKNGQKSRCVQSEPPPIQRAHSILQALYRDFLRHLALHCKTCFSVRCRACLHVLLVSLILLFFQRPPLSSHRNTWSVPMRHARECEKLCCVSAPENVQMLSSLPCRAALETVSPYRPQLIRGLCCIGSPEREHPGHGDKRRRRQTVYHLQGPQ